MVASNARSWKDACMPAQYLYRIPLASDPARLIIGTICLVFVLAIFASWLPRAIRWLASLPSRSTGQRVAFMTLALIPVAIGLVPVIILVALLKNPMTYVSEEGLTKEGLLLATPVTLRFADIARVSCGAGRGPGIRWFTLVTTSTRCIHCWKIVWDSQ
jgi:hypothetical protein